MGFKHMLFLYIDYSPCGESPADFRRRVVGGDISKRGWWPWQIAIFKISSKILKSLYVLTLSCSALYRKESVRKQKTIEGVQRLRPLRESTLAQNNLLPHEGLMFA